MNLAMGEPPKAQFPVLGAGLSCHIWGFRPLHPLPDCCPCSLQPAGQIREPEPSPKLLSCLLGSRHSSLAGQHSAGWGPGLDEREFAQIG